MLPVIELIAVLATTFFAGAAVYVNLVEHPARLSCSTELAATQWAPSYQRATVMQASLATIATVFSVLAGVLGGGSLWFVGALLIFAPVLITFAIIMPTNKQLLAPGREKSSAETRDLLVKWGRQHAIRSVLALAASVVLVWQLV
jgi:Domain of unknown function (DUF1772)